jgi:hypothetical protein
MGLVPFSLRSFPCFGGSATSARPFSVEFAYGSPFQGFSISRNSSLLLLMFLLCWIGDSCKSCFPRLSSTFGYTRH